MWIRVSRVWLPKSLEEFSKRGQSLSNSHCYKSNTTQIVYSLFGIHFNHLYIHMIRNQITWALFSIQPVLKLLLLPYFCNWSKNNLIMSYTAGMSSARKSLAANFARFAIGTGSPHHQFSQNSRTQKKKQCVDAYIYCFFFNRLIETSSRSCPVFCCFGPWILAFGQIRQKKGAECCSS